MDTFFINALLGSKYHDDGSGDVDKHLFDYERVKAWKDKFDVLPLTSFWCQYMSMAIIGA